MKKKQETRDEREENGRANDVGARDERERRDEKVERESEKRGGNTIIIGARDERKEREERVGCITITSKCER
jgi:hypothetical protein